MFRLFAIYIPAPTTGIFFSNTREKNNNELLIMNFKKKWLKKKKKFSIGCSFHEKPNQSQYDRWRIF